MQDAALTTANKALDGLLKLRRKTGELKPTSHKPAILTADLEKIVQYFGGIGEHPAWCDPIKLAKVNSAASEAQVGTSPQFFFQIHRRR